MVWPLTCSLFIECTMPLKVYKELSLTNWNHTYHSLEIKCNKLSCKKKMCRDLSRKRPLVVWFPCVTISHKQPLCAHYSRGGKWYLEKRQSRKILAGSRNLGSVFDKSRNLVFAWFVFTFFESRNFLPKSLGLGFLTRISASRRVSDFTIRHPLQLRRQKQLGQIMDI